MTVTCWGICRSSDMSRALVTKCQVTGCTRSIWLRCINIDTLFTSFGFWLTFDWSLFLRVKLTIFQHWFRHWLGVEKIFIYRFNIWISLYTSDLFVAIWPNRQIRYWQNNIKRRAVRRSSEDIVFDETRMSIWIPFNSPVLLFAI